jgi:hypothetical protein
VLTRPGKRGATKFGVNLLCKIEDVALFTHANSTNVQRLRQQPPQMPPQQAPVHTYAYS